MATYEATKEVSLPAGADFTAAANRSLALAIDGNGRCVACPQGGVPIGTLAMTATHAAVGSILTVSIFGSGKHVGLAGGAVAAGGVVVMDATSGQLVTVADPSAIVGNRVGVGIALESAADGERFSFLGQPIFKSA